MEQRPTVAIKRDEPKNEIILDFGNVELTPDNPRTHTKQVVFEKQPIKLEVKKRYGNDGFGIQIDDNPKLHTISHEAEKLSAIAEADRPRKVLELFQKYLSYAYNDVVEELAKTDKQKAEWVTQNTGLKSSVDRVVLLSQLFENKLGICRHLAVAYLWLAEKAGLQGVILNNYGQDIKNIQRNDLDKNLFRSAEVGKPVGAHTWCEIQLSNGTWIPVDPSTLLCGDTESSLQMFRDANYLGSVYASLEHKVEPDKILERNSTPLLFRAGESRLEANYWLELKSIKPPKIRLGQPPLPPTNEPYSGNARLDISVTDGVKDLGVKISIQERKLPKVSIEQNLSESQKKLKGTRLPEDWIIKNEDGKEVGNFTLTISKPRDGRATAYLNTINTNKERSRGYGRSAYLQIIDHLKSQGITFTSSEFQISRDAKKVWDWLVEIGKARLVDEGITDESKENEGYSTAYYEAR